MSKDTIQTWCYVFVVFTCFVSAVYVIIGATLDHRDRVAAEPVVEPGPEYTYNPWEAALTVCSDTNRDNMSGTWDPICFLTIRELANRSETGYRASTATCRDIYAMVSDELMLKDKYRVVVCGR